MAEFNTEAVRRTLTEASETITQNTQAAMEDPQGYVSQNPGQMAALGALALGGLAAAFYLLPRLGHNCKDVFQRCLKKGRHLRSQYGKHDPLLKPVTAGNADPSGTAEDAERDAALKSQAKPITASGGPKPSLERQGSSFLGGQTQVDTHGLKPASNEADSDHDGTYDQDKTGKPKKRVSPGFKG